MRLKDILRQKGGDVVTIESDRTVHDAICRLNEHKIGALVVTGEGGEIAGIITERDILHQCGERCLRVNESFAEDEGCPAMVRDVMTADLVIALPDDALDYAMGIMTKNRIRHLPVLEGGKLVGMVSIGDLVKASLEETEYENRQLKDYIYGVAP